WSVRLKLRVDISGIRHLIADKRFKLVGISFTYTGTDVRTQLRSMVNSMHSAGIVVVLGGGGVERMPQLAEQVGADSTARDARTLLVLIQKLLQHRRASTS